MAGYTSTRILTFLLLAACTALCQQNKKPALPDAPSPQTTKQPETLRSLSDTQRLPVDTMTAAGESAPHYDPGHFEDEIIQKQSSAVPQPLSFLAKRTTAHHDSMSGTFLGRIGDAASSLVLTRDEEGAPRLNTTYLLRVLTASVAQSAYRPYYRRSATQPISDFGSTVGSDAGMNVLHEFEPGILQLVKTHEPRFVSRIGGHLNRR